MTPKFKVGDKVLVTHPKYYNGQLINRIGKIQKLRNCNKHGREYLCVFAYKEKQVMTVWLYETEFRILTPLELVLK